RARSVIGFSGGNVVVCGSKGRCVDHRAHGLAATDLEVSTGWAGSATVGVPLTVTVSVVDRDAAATGVTLTVHAPAGTIVSAVPSRGRCTVGQAIICSLGRLAPNARVSVSVRVMPRRSGTMTIRASIVSDAPDLRPANDQATSAISVRAAPTKPTTVSSHPAP